MLYRQPYLDNGIEVTTTAPYTPYQNGVNERGGLVIMDGLRPMMDIANLPWKLWPEIVYTRVYLRNVIPTKALDGMTLY